MPTSKSLAPVNVTVFGKRVFADRILRPDYPDYLGDPNVASVLTGGTQRRRQCEEGGRGWSVATSQGNQGRPPEAGRSKEGSPSWGHQREPDLVPNLGFGLLGSGMLRLCIYLV
jgi:hypothetical protein